MKQTRIVRLLLLFVFVALTIMSSCSQKAALTFRTTKDLNNGGNSIVVRVYQLKSAESFQRASLDAFWTDDIQTLGSDLVTDPIEVTLRPGEERTLKNIEISDDTSHLGVAANFFQPAGDQWRAIEPVRSGKKAQIVLAVGNNQLLVSQLD